MIKKIAIVLVSLVVLFFASKFIHINSQNKLGTPFSNEEWNKTLSNMDLSDHCINNVYNNDYLGLSIKCPVGLMAIENYNNTKTQKEGVSFIDITKNMKDYDTLVNDYKFTAFSIHLEDEKFDHNNYYESIESKSNVKQTDVFNFAEKAEAITGPIPHKVENIKKIKFGENEFYAYSFYVDSKRVDYFVIPQNDEYIIISFFNQTETFINQALSSLKTFEPTRI